MASSREGRISFVQRIWRVAQKEHACIMRRPVVAARLFPPGLCTIPQTLAGPHTSTHVVLTLPSALFHWSVPKTGEERRMCVSRLVYCLASDDIACFEHISMPALLSN